MHGTPICLTEFDITHISNTMLVFDLDGGLSSRISGGFLNKSISRISIRKCQRHHVSATGNAQKRNFSKSHNIYYFSVVVDFLFIVTPIVGVCNCSMFCCTLIYVHSSIAIILKGRRELVALLNLSSWCLMMVERLFHAVPWGCLRFVIVVFPDHTHLLF